MCNMEFDANVKRAQFIDESVKIQETWGFSKLNEILEAIHTYAGHWYGSILWDLFGGEGCPVVQIMENNCQGS